MKTWTPLILSATLLSLAGVAVVATIYSEAGAPAPQTSFQRRFQPVLTEVDIGSFKDLSPVPLDPPGRGGPAPATREIGREAP